MERKWGTDRWNIRKKGIYSRWERMRMGSEEIQTGKSERKDEIAREDKYEILCTE